MAIATVPAPTFHEGARARRVRQLLLRDDPGRLAWIDPVGNAVTRLAGARRDRCLVVAAHLDTVFPDDVPHRTAIRGDRLVGPGVGDNAVAIAALLALPALLATAGVVPACDVVLVGTVGEEGYGNLGGMTAALDSLPDAAAVIAVEGHGLGRVTHVAVGSRRLEIHLSAPGGHSWADHGRPSAVHAAGRLIAQLAALSLPVSPRTTLNVGRVSGGSAINAIAADAQIEVELRSTDEEALGELLSAVERAAHKISREGVHASVVLRGVRPAGRIAADSLIVRRARSVLSNLNVRGELDASSTDANVAICRGIPAICVGITNGDNAHTADEWIAIPPITTGLAQLGALVAAICDDIATGQIGRGRCLPPGSCHRWRPTREAYVR